MTPATLSLSFNVSAITLRAGQKLRKQAESDLVLIWVFLLFFGSHTESYKEKEKP